MCYYIMGFHCNYTLPYKFFIFKSYSFTAKREVSESFYYLDYFKDIFYHYNIGIISFALKINSVYYMKNYVLIK